MSLAGLAARTLLLLSGLGLVAATDNRTFPYNYTFPATGNLVGGSLYNDSNTSAWDNNNGQLVCNRGSLCYQQFVTVPLMGSGFCAYGKFDTPVYLYFYNRSLGSATVSDGVAVATDGNTVCLNSRSRQWNSTSDAVRISGATVIDHIENDASTNLPDGWTKAHYSVINRPFVVNNALDTNTSSFFFPNEAQVFQGSDGSMGVHIPSLSGVSINIPPNCGMIALNGYLGQTLGAFRTEWRDKTFPFYVPLSTPYRKLPPRSAAALPILVTPLYPSNESYFLIYRALGDTTGPVVDKGINITSVDLYIFERDDVPVSIPSTKKTNIAAIAGGAAGGAVALILLLILAWFLLCRQPRPNRSRVDDSRFIDDAPVATTAFASQAGDGGPAPSTHKSQFVTRSSTHSYKSHTTRPLSKDVEAAPAQGDPSPGAQHQFPTPASSPTNMVFPFPPVHSASASVSPGPPHQVSYTLLSTGQVLAITPGFSAHEGGGPGGSGNAHAAQARGPPATKVPPELPPGLSPAWNPPPVKHHKR